MQQAIPKGLDSTTHGCPLLATFRGQSLLRSKMSQASGVEAHSEGYLEASGLEVSLTVVSPFLRGQSALQSAIEQSRDSVQLVACTPLRFKARLRSTTVGADLHHFAASFSVQEPDA